MQGSNKPSTIHVNPMFKENPKNVIHINPKVHINLAIHVNPRMMNAHALQYGGMRQRNIQKPVLIEKSECREAPCVQKSVYVNPKLMEKLTTRIPDVEVIEDICPSETQRIQGSRLGGDARRHVISEDKCPSANLVSLSRRKLVRIRPESCPQISVKLPVNKCASGGDEKSARRAQGRKITRGKLLKKVNGTNLLKSKVYLVKGKVNSPLKKINNVLAQSRRINREVGSLRKVNSVKVAPKSSVSILKSPGNKYKIDRTGGDKSKAGITRKTLGSRSNNKNLVNIDGVFYRSSKSRLVKSSSSSSSPKTPKKPNPSTSRPRKLRTHVVINGKIAKINTSNLCKTSLQTPGQKSNYKHVISNRVKQRSLQILRHKMCKNNQPCLLFQRFGYCAKSIKGTCPKVHDKKQVALCKNFLQGKCLLDNCPLSHDVGPEKMPTCKYFLEGCCTRDNCQYLHVKVSANKPICVPFLRGYCAKGDQCKERHTNNCPEFDKYGRCAKGKNCPYPHKTCLLQQQNTLRLPRPLKSFNKTKSLTKSVDISSHDDGKKRYYDERCRGDDLDRVGANISGGIGVMEVLGASEDDDILLVTDDEMKSQPIDEEERPRRPPVGPLPSYIPIN